jgi:hypothetical protein
LLYRAFAAGWATVWDFDDEGVPGVTPRDNSAASIAASGMVLLQEQIDGFKVECEGTGKDCQGNRAQRKYFKVAKKSLEASVKLALAGGISFAESANHDGVETYIGAPVGTDVSKGSKSTLLHGTSNNNLEADPKNFDSELNHGDFYFIEARNRLLEYE